MGVSTHITIFNVFTQDLVNIQRKTDYSKLSCQPRTGLGMYKKISWGGGGKIYFPLDRSRFAKTRNAEGGACPYFDSK